MRDCSTNRAGFDRVLMAVAATFLTVSATSALAAQSTTPRASAAELAIDAAVPRPEPANVPPPTASDFKMDTTASVPDAAKADRQAGRARRPQSRREPKPAEIVTAPAGQRRRDQDRLPRPTPRPPLRRRAEPAKEPVKAASNVAAGRPAGRRQTARHARRQIAALLRPQERARGRREILHGARLRAAVDAGRQTDRQRQGRDRPPEGCRLRRPQSGRLSGAGFRRRDLAGRSSPKPN